MEALKCGNRIVPITHSERPLFKNPTITKGEVVAYYHTIAPFMLPYLKNRPLTMQRFPEGIFHEGFYQKDASDYFPSWIKRIKIKKKTDGSTHYVVCNNAATLVYLANQGCLTPHLWLSRIDKINYPDRMIFDLDPLGVTFNAVRETALLFKKILDQEKLHSLVMTTGSHGLHVLIALSRTKPFGTIRANAHTLAEKLVLQNPKLLTLEVSKAKRKNKIYIDVLRNAFAQTAVAPYSIRPHPHAPVATPLHWDELLDKKLSSQRYTIKNIFKRLDEVGNVWKIHKK